MDIPLFVKIKSFLGLYVLTPFEEDLLFHLRESLCDDEKEILDFQVSNFTMVRRFIEPLSDPKAHGYTNFYTFRFGVDVAPKRQLRRFKLGSRDATLATARVSFFDGNIAVRFIVVDGLLFRIEYRSPQKIYYPTGEYTVAIQRNHELS